MRLEGVGTGKFSPKSSAKGKEGALEGWICCCAKEASGTQRRGGRGRARGEMSRDRSTVRGRNERGRLATI